jgi:hypothetical protein
MKTKVKKAKPDVPFDPVLFAAKVAARKPTPKDKNDCKERDDDVIEPKEYETMEDMAEDL